MPDVPRVAPVRIVVEIACLAMTGPAEHIEFGGRQALRILNCPRRSPRTYVRRARSMACFASHARFGGLNLITCLERYRPGGVATEASEGCAHGIESPVDQIVRIRVAWREVQGFRRRVVAQPMFGDRLLAGLAHPGGSFFTSPKCPLGRAFRSWNSGYWAVRSGRRQRPGVSGFRLRFEFSGMAHAACVAPDVLARERSGHRSRQH